MTDYKQLCRELVLLDQAEPSDYANWKYAWNAAIKRARAALAESVPEAESTLEIGGVKYKRVEEPPTLYDKLETWIEYGNFAQSKDVLVNEILNIVKEFIPEPYEGVGLSEYFLGYNDAIRKMEEKLK